MIDLKNIITDFQKTSAYAVLDDLVRICGVDSVLGALSEITAAQQSTSAMNFGFAQNANRAILAQIKNVGLAKRPVYNANRYTNQPGSTTDLAPVTKGKIKMKNLINWLIWLYKNKRENTTLSFYEKNIDVYIDGKLISPNDKNWHHIAVVAKDIPHFGWIEEITEYTKTN